MKRLHIHIAVNELSESVNFYSSLFNSPPTVEHTDYAKWNLDEPAVNFAISNRGHSSGINHLGIQVDSDNELEEIAKRLADAEINSAKQKESSCCYAQSNKYWALDPQGIAWESFHTLETIPVFGEDTKTEANKSSSACCIPADMNNDNKSGSDGCCS